MKRVSAAALLMSAWTVFAGCSSGDPELIYEDSALEAGVGSARLNLVVGDRTINSVTAVISAKHSGFATQTHVIDVSGGGGVISIFFGNLPVSNKYKIELTAADCEGAADFKINAASTTLVPVTLICGDGETVKETGSVQITGTIVGGSTSSCNHITKIVAAPSIQNGSGPIASVEVVLNEGVSPTSIVWSSSSTTGGSGVIGALAGTTDRAVTFDCSTNGTVFLVANVVALEGAASCAEQARVTIECLNQSGTNPCGNGVLDAGEQCDGALGIDACPAGSLGTVTCTPQCTENTSGCVPVTLCGNGQLNAGEQCDGAVGIDACPAGTLGTVTCTPQCTENTSGCVPVALCGNGQLNAGEQCDGTVGIDACPAGTLGTVTCTPQCTEDTSGCVPVTLCGNGVLNAGEQCDGAAGIDACPAGTTGTVTCTSTCTENTSGCTSGTVLGECGLCALDACATQRSVVDANLPTVDPIIACVLGPDWEAGNRAAAASCGNADLLTCYCGTLAGQDCSNAAPSALNGQCVNEVLTGTGCTTSACVAPIFLNPANANGKAMQYIQCQQDFCYDLCFNP